jgi:hypothetical protein
LQFPLLFTFFSLTPTLPFLTAEMKLLIFVVGRYSSST